MLGANTDRNAVGIVRTAPITNINSRPYRSAIAPKYKTVAARPKANALATLNEIFETIA